MAGAADAPADAFFGRGWVAFAPDPPTSRWAAAARREADRLLADPKILGADLRCGGTWFAGVNAFPNDAEGAVPERGVPPLDGGAAAFIAQALGLSGFDWDRGQLSACYPGYPRQGEDETPGNHRYRLRHDAAHVDGLLRDATRRRWLGETHGFILGMPLRETAPGSAPFVVWEGSHEIVRAALRARLAGIPPVRWWGEDVTEAYHAARQRAFETCQRREIVASSGGAYLVHRLALHGVGPWTAPDTAPPRPVVYFRPDPFPGASPGWWLDMP